MSFYGDSLCCAGDSVAVAIPGLPGPAGGGTANAITVNGIAAVPLGGHRAVVRQPGGLLEYADAATLAHAGLPIYLTTGAVNALDPVAVTAEGEVVEGSWSWTPGPVWLGLNGLLTQTPPTLPGSVFSVILGYAGTPTSLYFDRNESLLLT